MANLKDLKTRIGSVKSTQKITKAMKMVAASKLRRAQERAEAARPYSMRMERMIVTLAENSSKDNAPALLVGHKDSDGNIKDKTHLIIVVTSDRGLCGGFNGNIAKATKQKITTLSKKGKAVKILTVGKKGFELLKGDHASKVIDNKLASETAQPEYFEAEAVAEKVIAMFEKGEIDSCSVVYNKFVNALTQIVTFQPLIPLDLSAVEAGIKEIDKGAIAVCDYEPSEEAVLSQLLPQNIATQIYHSYLESSASEQGSRMTAMDNATRNAGDMIDKLSLVYNRTRQAAITTELTEIVAGAEAV